MIKSLLNKNTLLLTCGIAMACFANAQKIASGNNHALMICTDGSVTAFGVNAQGQVGNSSRTSAVTPVSVDSVTNAIQVDAGLIHSFAVDNAGNLWGWGGNAYGQLGKGTSTPGDSIPTKILDSIMFIAAGGEHSIAVKDDGTVLAWGRNSNGQLGLGATSFSELSPQVVPGLDSVIMACAGDKFSAVLDENGNVYTWGENVNGQLANSSTVQQLSPVKATLSNIIEITAGEDHILALDANGNVWAAGYNQFTQATGSANQKDSIPAIVLSGIVKVHADKTYSFATDTCGTTFGWGGNQQFGQSGTGSAGFFSVFPPAEVTVVGDRITEVYVGVDYAIAATEMGEAYAWGEHPVGLGNTGGTTSSTTSSVLVAATCTLDTINLPTKDSCTTAPLPDPTAFNNTPHPVPGKIEAEDYGEGGEGIAYHDNETGNVGGITTYRTENDVEMENCTDTGGGYNVGWVAPGEWLRYVVDVTATGKMQVDVRVASMNGGGTVKVTFENNAVEDTISFGDTGGWQDWITVTLDSNKMNLTQLGQDIMRVDIVAGEFNLNFVEISGGNTLSIANDILTTDIAPNPFDNEVRFTTTSEVSVSIFNVVGQQLYTAFHPTGMVHIDFSSIGIQEKGIYYIHLNNGGQTVSKKVVKR